MSSEINKYLREDMIDNIYNVYKNVFVIKYNQINNNDKYVGKVLLKVNIKKDKEYILLNDLVEFRIDKIKWKDKNICLVDPYWVKKYYNKKILLIKVKVLKSKANENKDKRKYFYDYEYIKLNYSQFIKRRLIENFGKSDYSILEAYSNFQNRRKYVGYYKALNETSKHYLLPHDLLKNKIIPDINNALKDYKKEWKILYEQSLQEDLIQQKIDEFIEESKEKVGKVINLKGR